MSEILVKIYGERHTGTNLVERVLAKWPGVRLTPKGHYLTKAKQRARDVSEFLGGGLSGRALRHIREALQDDWTLADGPLGAWKHAAAKFTDAFAANNVRVLFVVKAPGAWLASFFRLPYHRLTSRRSDETIEDFIKQPWISVARERIADVLPSPLALWNVKVASYLDFASTGGKAGVRCEFVRSEDLILDQVGEFRRLAAWLGVAPEKFSERQQSIKGDDRTLDDLKHYYGNELWRGKYTEEGAGLVRDIVDPGLAERFGYRL